MTIGSGRRYSPNEVKPIVENAICLDLTDLKKDGGIDGNFINIVYSSGSEEIMTLLIIVEEVALSLRYDYKGMPKRQEIKLSTIPCFGISLKQYLICPVCGAQRNQLYLGVNGYFACRICNGLGYRVQRLNPSQAHSYAAEKLNRVKLKQSENGPKSIGSKPRYMRNKTYHEIVDRIIYHEKKSHETFMVYFNKIRGGFDAKLSEPNVLRST